MVSNFHQQQVAQAQAISQLTSAMSRMYQRVQNWDTTYLAAIMHRFAELMPPPPPTPTSEPRNEQDHDQSTQQTVAYEPSTQAGLQVQPPPQQDTRATLLDRAEHCTHVVPEWSRQGR